jgi:hypothetical protein
MNREEALAFRLPLEKDSGGITVIYSNILDLLDVLFLTDHDKDITDLDNAVRPGNHVNLVGNHVPDCDHLDIDVLVRPRIAMPFALSEISRFSSLPSVPSVFGGGPRSGSPHRR